MDNSQDRQATQDSVAAEVRAELARQRMSGRRAAAALGWTPPYLSRRLSGDVPFDIADLTALARLLDVPASNFLAVITGVRTAAPWTPDLSLVAA